MIPLSNCRVTRPLLRILAGRNGKRRSSEDRIRYSTRTLSVSCYAVWTGLCTGHVRETNGEGSDRPTMVYLDDVIVVVKSLEEMVTYVRQIFDRLKAAGLKLKPKKCSLFSKQVTFLGHVISSDGVAKDPSKIQNVKDWPVPTNVSELRSFLGLFGYYRRYLKNFSAIAKCLHKLTKKGRKYLWDDNCQNVFENLKERLISAPI